MYNPYPECRDCAMRNYAAARMGWTTQTCDKHAPRLSPFTRRALARELPASDLTGHKAAVL